MRGVLIYMAIYLFMNIGTFAVILCMTRDGRMVEEIDDLAGLSRTQPALALALAIFMFSMAGIPPLAGFFAKFYVFLAAIDAGLYGLAVIGVLASVVGAYYYLRIVKLMYFDEPAAGFDRPIGREMQAVLRHHGGRDPVLLRLSRPRVDGADGRGGALRRMTASAAPFRLHSVRADRQHQRRSAAPGRRRRARGHAGPGARAERRPRPARPRLGLAARQSLLLAAAAASPLPAADAPRATSAFAAALAGAARRARRSAAAAPTSRSNGRTTCCIGGASRAASC